MKYSYNDISIVPAICSNIQHRSDCNPYTPSRKLPIFTAPMSCIVNTENIQTYEDNKITVIIPRNIDLQIRITYMNIGYWIAVSLSEVNEIQNLLFPHARICIDVANGHMKSIYDAVKNIKNRCADTIIMVGNIANPNTVITAIESGVDYIRLGIGGGNGCITSSNTGVHYPMASLIQEVYDLKIKYNSNIKIIADGGIRGYADINKALALGADYVMIGSLFAQCLESNLYMYEKNNNSYIETNTLNYLINKDKQYYHKFYGMASKEGQKDLFGKKTHTAEGISKYIPIKYTISQWTKNVTDYICSAMSYCNATTLKEFIGKVNTVVISNNTYNSINK